MVQSEIPFRRISCVAASFAAAFVWIFNPPCDQARLGMRQGKAAFPHSPGGAAEAWQRGNVTVVVKTHRIPFWGRCTTHFRTYFSWDGDVHWGCDLDLTHGQDSWAASAGCTSAPAIRNECQLSVEATLCPQPRAYELALDEAEAQVPEAGAGRVACKLWIRRFAGEAEGRGLPYGRYGPYGPLSWQCRCQSQWAQCCLPRFARLWAGTDVAPSQ